MSNAQTMPVSMHRGCSEHMPRTYVRTYTRTNNLQDVDRSLTAVDARGREEIRSNGQNAIASLGSVIA